MNIKELWAVAYTENGKNYLVKLSIKTTYELTNEWAEQNRIWLKDKEWFIVKYELAEDF